MSDLGCGAKCAKYLMLLINFFFLLIGALLLGFGAFLVVDLKAFHSQHLTKLVLSASNDLIFAAAIVILVVGILMFFVAIIGCCGAQKESTGCLSFYVCVVIFLLILQIVAVIMAGVYYDKIMATLSNDLLKTVRNDYYKKNETTTNVDSMQFNLKCCGVTAEGPLDWKASYYHNTTNTSVPVTCCTMINDSKIDNLHPKNKEKCRALAYEKNSTHRADYIYTEGCEDKLNNLIKHYVGVLIGVVIAVVVVQIVFVVIACLLKSSIAKGYEYV